MDSVHPLQLIAPAVVGLMAATVTGIVCLSGWLQTHYLDKTRRIVVRAKDIHFGLALASLLGEAKAAKSGLRQKKQGGSLEEVAKYGDFRSPVFQATGRLCRALRATQVPQARYRIAGRALRVGLLLALGGEVGLVVWLFCPAHTVLWALSSFFGTGLACGLAGLLQILWLDKRFEELSFSESEGVDGAGKGLPG